jgi:cyclopropane fatty-acyl-phospholipid synthase-like methyltransferase
MIQIPGRRAARYDKAFYDDFTASSLRSGEIVLGALLHRYAARSIIDVGCGVGAWLKAAQNLGASSLRGFDGPWVDDSQLLIEPTSFTRISFESADWPDLGKVDLAISLEVAEHLSLTQGKLLVKRLCNAAPVVLFSAAIPHQGGEGHQNEQWQSWWAEIFAAQGYRPSLFLRRITWTNAEVSFWYSQNMVVYVDPARAGSLIEPDEMAQPMDVIHPDLYQIRVIKRGRHGRLRRLIDAIRMR